jgi:hypothetical protein
MCSSRSWVRTDGQTGKPLPAEKCEDPHAIDAEEAERADDRRHPAENDDQRRHEAQRRARHRANKQGQWRRDRRQQSMGDGDGGKPHEDADRDIDTAHGEQQGHAETGQHQLCAVAGDGHGIACRREIG